MKEGTRGGCAGGQRRRERGETGAAHIGARRGWLGVPRSAIGVAAILSLGAPDGRGVVDHAIAQVRGPLRVHRDVTAFTEVSLRRLTASGVVLAVPVPEPPIVLGRRTGRSPRTVVAICAGVRGPNAVRARTAEPRANPKLARGSRNRVKFAGRNAGGRPRQCIKPGVIDLGVSPLLRCPISCGETVRFPEACLRRSATADTRRPTGARSRGGGSAKRRRGLIPVLSRRMRSWRS